MVKSQIGQCQINLLHTYMSSLIYCFAAIVGCIREKKQKWILQGKPVLTTGEKKFYQHTVTLGL